MGLQISSLPPHSLLFPSCKLDHLEKSFNQTSFIPQALTETLHRINFLECEEVIPSEVAILLKNNLSDPEASKAILSEFIVKSVDVDKKLILPIRGMVQERGVERTILFLYTCHLQEKSSRIDSKKIQLASLLDTPRELFKKISDHEEMESKSYIERWLSSLQFPDQEIKDKIRKLRASLDHENPKTEFLDLLSLIIDAETNLVHKACMEELYAFLEKEPESRCILSASRVFKSFVFYQKFLNEIKTISSSFTDKSHWEKADIFTRCKMKDLMQNATGAKHLKTSYSLLYGLLAKERRKILGISEQILLAKGANHEESVVANQVESALKKENKHCAVVDLSSEILSEDLEVENQNSFIQSLAKTHRAFALCNWFAKADKPPSSLHTKQITQYLLRVLPDQILSVDHKQQDLVLEAAKTLKLPLTCVATNLNTRSFEELSKSPYNQLKIALPTENSHLSKAVSCGLPVAPKTTLTTEELKNKWNFSSEERNRKIIVIQSLDGTSPWPVILAKQFQSEPIALVVLTQNKSFENTLKTTIAPKTTIPIRVLSDLTPQEKKEIFSLSDLIIDKSQPDDSSLLLEACQIKKPLLLDNSPPSLFSRGIYGVFISLFNTLLTWIGKKNELAETTAQKKFLLSQDLGSMADSIEEFKTRFVTMISTSPSVSAPEKVFQTEFPKLLGTQKHLNPPESKVLNLFSGY